MRNAYNFLIGIIVFRFSDFYLLSNYVSDIRSIIDIVTVISIILSIAFILNHNKKFLTVIKYRTVILLLWLLLLVFIFSIINKESYECYQSFFSVFKQLEYFFYGIILWLSITNKTYKYYKIAIINNICLLAFIFILVIPFSYIGLIKGSVVFFEAEAIERKFRVIAPGINTLVICLFYFLAKIKNSSKLKYIIISVILLILIISQLHRGVILSAIISFAIYIYLTLNVKNIIKPFLAVIIFGSLILNSQLSTILSTISIEDSNILHRFVMLYSSIEYAINTSFFGIGFNWLCDYNRENYILTSFVLTPTFDSGWTNLFLIFGCISFILIFFLGRFLIKSFKQFPNKSFPKSWLLPVTVYFLLINFSSESMFIGSDSMGFYFILSLIFGEYNYESIYLSKRRVRK